MEARTVFVADAVRAALDDAARRADDLVPLMEDIGGLLADAARSRIAESNVGPDGVPWPKSFRVLSGQGGKTLRDSGNLLDSIVYAAQRREVAVGTNVPYAGIHQFGGKITAKDGGALRFRLADGTTVMVGSVTIPARPYLGVSEADEQIIVRDLVPAWLEVSLGDVDVV